MQKYINGQGDNVNTVITRPSTTSLLAISSNDRYNSWASRRINPTNPFNILIQKNQALMNGYFRRIAMTEFRMNWTLPNIAQAWGNSSIQFSYINSGTTYSFNVTLSDGFYGAEELSNALQARIRGGTPTVSGIPGFTVQVSFPSEDDLMYFSAPAGYTFWFTPMTGDQRQLFDMLALPTLATPGIQSFLTGIPDLRATEYVDLVCSQLTNNMLQKDSTSAPIVRDMIARIYLDDDVPSQSLVTTNYNNVTYASTTSTAYILISPDTVRYTVSSTAGFSNGDIVSITGLTGGNNWTGDSVGNAIIITSTVMDVLYSATVSGTATGTATIKATNIGALSQTSTPQTTWDDRVNGVTPFVLYRQFPYPKQIRWEHTQPIGNLRFELFDSQGRSMADLWSQFSGTAISDVTAGTFISSTLVTPVVTIGNNVTYTTPSNPVTLGYAVGQIVSISGTTGGSGYNTTAQVIAVSGSSSYTVQVKYATAPTGSISSLTGAYITVNQVNYTVNTSNGFRPYQFANMSGLYQTGYDGLVTIVSIPDSTHITVSYPGLLQGAPPSSFTYASIQSTIDYQSAFAWNSSLLCSED